MDDEIRPWTIKAIPPEIRNAAIAAAEREKTTIGAWICRAILEQVKADQGQSRELTVVDPPAPPGPGPTAIDEAHQLMNLAQRLSEISGTPVPPAIITPATKLLRDRLKALIGRP